MGSVTWFWFGIIHVVVFKYQANLICKMASSPTCLLARWTSAGWSDISLHTACPRGWFGVHQSVEVSSEVNLIQRLAFLGMSGSKRRQKLQHFSLRSQAVSFLPLLAASKFLDQPRFNRRSYTRHVCWQAWFAETTVLDTGYHNMLANIFPLMPSELNFHYLQPKASLSRAWIRIQTCSALFRVEILPAKTKWNMLLSAPPSPVSPPQS